VKNEKKVVPAKIKVSQRVARPPSKCTRMLA
jgi:hypothetical protein